MATSSSDSICVVCSMGGGGGGRLLQQKGLATLIDVSHKRGDDRVHEELSSPGDHFVHDKCYKGYTAPKNIASAQRLRDTGGRSESPSPSLRSESKPFDYQTHCLICAEELDLETTRRHPERCSPICNVEMVSKEKTSIIQETLLKACEQRQDTIAVNVKARILFAGDIRAVDAKYHHRCLQTFISERNIVHSSNVPKANVRNLDSLNDEAFIHLCKWLTTPEQRQCQHTLNDLCEQLSTYLPKGVKPYSNVHLKRRLIDHFGKQVTITELEGRANVVTLKERATSILHESYLDSAMDLDEHEENIRLAKLVGSNIKEELLDIDQPTDVYPTPSDVDLDKTDMAPAPPDLLRDIRCSCKSSKRLCASCSCSKKRLPCSIHCKCEGQCDNSTAADKTSEENEDV